MTIRSKIIPQIYAEKNKQVATLNEYPSVLMLHPTGLEELRRELVESQQWVPTPKSAEVSYGQIFEMDIMVSTQCPAGNFIVGRCVPIQKIAILK